MLETLGRLRKFQADPIAMMGELRRQEGDLAELKLGPKRILFCFHPDHAERVLKTQAAKYRKSRLIFDKIVPLTGRRGLVQLEGSEGREKRQLTGQSLAFEALTEIFPLLKSATEEGIDALTRRHDEEIDLSKALTDIVLRNALILVLGEDLGTTGGARLADAFLEANTLCGSGIRNLVTLPRAIPTPGNLRLNRAIRELDRALYALIDIRARDFRAESRTERKDLLSLMLRSGAPREEIRDQLATFLFAGHETTASSLAWTFHLLSRDRQQEESVRQECSTRKIEHLNDLRHLPRTLNAYQESLRLFPPAWTLAREALEDDTLQGRAVPRGTLVLLGVGQIHRHESFWSDPERFDPDRFAQGRSEDSRHSHSFIPFGGGSRICIGMRTAFIEAALILSTALPRFKIRVRPGFEPGVKAMITAHPAEGIPVRIERINR